VAGPAGCVATHGGSLRLSLIGIASGRHLTPAYIGVLPARSGRAGQAEP
jgi:hypothetical protein